MSPSTPSPPLPIAYPRLPPKLILTSTKAYFSPSRTIEYLHSILDPTTQILPLLETHKSEILFVLIPDHLTIYPCAQILSEKYPGPAPTPAPAPSSQSSTPNPSSSSTTTAPFSPTTWPIALGAQNVFWASSYGAYTGETVSAGLASLGVRIVELNHAERRRHLGETDETTARKAGAATAAGLIPLVCIGELEKPDLAGPLSSSVGKAMAQLRPQIQSLLRAVPENAPVVFAYEPVWAIGAAEPAGVEYVGPVVQAIREVVASLGDGCGKARSGEVKVVYGGSAGPGLWSGKMNGGNGLGRYVDGLFLGRFAHRVEGVRDVVQEVVESL